ncbi:MAG: hypothetical protein ACTIC1_11925 [Brevibacterium sp.]
MRLDPERVGELFALAASAPSAHNTQPWVPELAFAGDADSPAEVILTVDPGRTLPFGDPRSEDLHLAMGCWVESFAIAAAEVGLRTRMIAVTGRGETLRIRLCLDLEDVMGSDATPAGEVDAVAGLTDFGTSDLRHRQVDRGRLARDEASFAAVRERIEAELAAHRVHLIEVPHALWTRLQTRASRSSLSSAPIVEETLDWLRFDPRDPRYLVDGLNAECLRVPPIPARIASGISRCALRPLLAQLIAATLRPVRFIDRHRRLSVEAAATDGAHGSAPQHVVLAVSADEHDTTESRTGREIELGRLLLRTWLLLDRAGLRVDVHSEIKDCAETQEVVARLCERHLEPTRDNLAREELIRENPLRVFSAFSLGRSMTAVPRSHRRHADRPRS